MLDKLVKNLKNKPLKVRKRIMWVSVGLCALFIFLFWLVIRPEFVKKQDINHSELETFKEEFKEKTKNINFSDISSEISRFTNGVSEEVEEKKEIKESEVPRLPLEIN